MTKTKLTNLSELIGGEKPKKGKGIEFTHYLYGEHGEWSDDIISNPKDFKELIIMPSSFAGCQMFMAIEDNGFICYYKGKLNDGFIEQ